MIDGMKIFRIRIYGKVHGVYFREGTKGVADMLRIKGWIRNEPDGSIQMEVKGDAYALEEFLIWCGTGPERAKVERVETEELQEPLIQNPASVKYPFLNFDILK